MKRFFGTLVWICFCSMAMQSQNATFRVMSYNLLNFPNPSNNNTLGNDTARIHDFSLIATAINPDIIIMEEFLGFDATKANALLAGLNNESSKTYARTNMFSAQNSGDLGIMFFYNTALLTLEASTIIPPTTTTAAGNLSPRNHAHYKLYFNDPNLPIHGIKTYLDCFGVHLKAGDKASSADNPYIREVGAIDLMNYIENNLGISANIIVGGDFNMYSANYTNSSSSVYEPAYGQFINTSNYPNNYLNDVIGPWTRENSCCTAAFTQSPISANYTPSSYGNSSAGGGLDDRFDFIWMDNSAKNADGGGSIPDIAYVANSYSPFGKEGVPMNGDVLDGTNALKNELRTMSDHYPIYADFTVTYPNSGAVCSVISLAAGTTGACDSTTLTYTQDIIVSYSNAPTTGNLIVNGQSFAIGISPQTVTLTNLPANGLPVSISASFSANPSCALTISNLFTAPEPCSSSGGGTLACPLLMTGIIDGPLTGGVPKAVELYVIENIPNLSLYGLGSANNGGGSDGQEFTFPAVSVAAGTYIYVASDSLGFADFFGFAPDYISGAVAVNGDDAIEIFCEGSVSDIFGDITYASATGLPWLYMDGWAYRNDCATPTATFDAADWTYSGQNALDFQTTNATATLPFPIGTYQPCPPTSTCEMTIDLMTPSDNLSDSTYTVSVDSVINAYNSIYFGYSGTAYTVLYNAGNYIDFFPDFYVNADTFSVFDAVIQPCSAAAKTQRSTTKNINYTLPNTKALQFYPNPAQDHLNILVEETGVLEIYNMSGQLMKQVKNADSRIFNISITDLPNGIYALRYTGEQDSRTEKLVISR